MNNGAVEAAKAAARGRWPAILAAVGGIPLEVLDGQHHPCPRCGGKDRFRLIDRHAGAVLCNACFSRCNGDGISALMWLRGCAFPEALHALGQHLGVAIEQPARGGFDRSRLPPSPPRAPDAPRVESRAGWTRDDARVTWAAAAAWARSDDAETLERTAAAWAWLADRGLTGAWETGYLGVLHDLETGRLPEPARRWLSSGHVILAPLFDGAGDVQEVAARTIQPDKQPKVLTAKGSKVRGLIYASQAGRRLLRGGLREAGAVVLGEGLTDAMALAGCASVPALAARSASDKPESYIGPWASGRTVLLAFDADEAGEAAAAKAGRVVRDRGGVPVRVRPPRGCKDVCDALALHGEAWVGEWLDFAAERARGRAAE